MKIVCLDMEGVIAPEIWVELATKTGISELKRTTRDEPDYNVLMKYRLEILHQNNVGMEALLPIIKDIDPLPGAKAFIEVLKKNYQVVILSDTFYEFVGPLMEKLGYPTLFCHKLEVDSEGKWSGYSLRMKDHKRSAVEAFKSLNFYTFAAGDSYNDTAMLKEADFGVLFRPPLNVVQEFPQFDVVKEYDELLAKIEKS